MEQISVMGIHYIGIMGKFAFGHVYSRMSLRLFTDWVELPS